MTTDFILQEEFQDGVFPFIILKKKISGLCFFFQFEFVFLTDLGFFLVEKIVY
jgi:hypothetical protein